MLHWLREPVPLNIDGQAIWLPSPYRKADDPGLVSATDLDLDSLPMSR
jgi:hypothetical protein